MFYSAFLSFNWLGIEPSLCKNHRADPKNNPMPSGYNIISCRAFRRMINDDTESVKDCQQ